MSEGKFGSWSVAESPITIEYSLVVIEEMRYAVLEGFQRFSRGGIEVGGVLYGTREGRTVRVLAMRDIGCEHARGPALLLSDTDRAALAQQLQQDEQDPRLEGMICVGWFLSHTRSEIVLSEADLEIFSAFFPAPWQVTLVIRPGRGGSMRAGFFVREADGTVKCERSYMDFNFPDRLAGVLESVHRRDRGGGAAFNRRPAAISRAETGSELVPTPPPEREFFPVPPSLAGPQLLPARPPRRRWEWLVAWLVMVIALVVFGLRFYVFRGTSEPVSLSVAERDGQLQIEWNHSAKPVVSATRGSLTIVDGGDSRNVPLSPQDLARGRFTYLRNTGDVEVRMTVADAGGATVQEASRFLGSPPVRVQAGELEEIKARRDELETEVTRLRQQNQLQTDRIQELERTLRIMQTRLGVAPAPAPAPAPGKQ